MEFSGKGESNMDMTQIVRSVVSLMGVPIGIAFCAGFASAVLGNIVGAALGELLSKKLGDYLSRPSCRRCVHYSLCQTSGNFSLSSLCTAFKRKNKQTHTAFRG